MRLLFVIALLSLRQIPAAPVSALAFSAEGETLASSGHKRVDLRSPADGTVQDAIPCPFPRVTSLAFAPGGLLIVGGGVPGESGLAVVLGLTDESVMHKWGGYEDLVTCVAAAGTRFAVGGADHRATVYDGTNGVELTGHSGPVQAIAFADEFILTASADRSIKSWSMKGELLRSFNHHTEAVHALAIRPRSEPGLVECASGSADGTVRIWQPAIGRMVRIIRGHDGPVFALAYAPDGSALYSAGKEGIVRRLDVASDQILETHKVRSDVIYSISISPDGRKLAAGGWGGGVNILTLSQ